MHLTYLQWAILGGAALPLIYYAGALCCAWDFFLQRDQPSIAPLPGISLLKPMRGLDRETWENLASFCRLDYPQFEILFGFDDHRDAAIPVVEKLIADFPGVHMRILVGSEAHGSNNKVNKLCRLAREAAYDLLVVTDSDTRVAPDYLRRLASAFQNPRVGAATSLYRGMASPNIWSELEALHLSTDFLPSAVVATKLGVRFTLGATMAVRRAALAEIGGFEALADMAAEDHELGSRLAARGYQVVLVDAPIKTECSSQSFREFFQHQVRWAVVTRDSKPWGHLGFIFAQGLPWTLAASAVAPSRTIALGFFAAYLILRVAVAFAAGAWGLQDSVVKKRWWLFPLGDALGFLVWLCSLFKHRVYWQGIAYDVRRGQLIPVTANTKGAAPSLAEGRSSFRPESYHSSKPVH